MPHENNSLLSWLLTLLRYVVDWHHSAHPAGIVSNERQDNESRERISEKVPPNRYRFDCDPAANIAKKGLDSNDQVFHSIQIAVQHGRGDALSRVAPVSLLLRCMIFLVLAQMISHARVLAGCLQMDRYGLFGGVPQNFHVHVIPHFALVQLLVQVRGRSAEA